MNQAVSVTFQPEPVERADGTVDMHDGAPQLNVCGRNADLLFDRLGLDRGLWGGQVNPADLCRRAMRVANRSCGDNGRPGNVVGQWTDGALSDGYLARTASELMAVAQAATDLGVDVQWT